ncbi:hypothetical protein ACJX0J_038979 [Zea mays]
MRHIYISFGWKEINHNWIYKDIFFFDVLIDHLIYREDTKTLAAGLLNRMIDQEIDLSLKPIANKAAQAQDVITADYDKPAQKNHFSVVFNENFSNFVFYGIYFFHSLHAIHILIFLICLSEFD